MEIRPKKSSLTYFQFENEASFPLFFSIVDSFLVHLLNFLVGEHCPHILPGPASDCHQPNLQRHLWLHFLTAAGKGSPIVEQIVKATWLFCCLWSRFFLPLHSTIHQSDIISIISILSPPFSTTAKKHRYFLYTKQRNVLLCCCNNWKSDATVSRYPHSCICSERFIYSHDGSSADKS
jgi:hypothetical protein